MKKWTLSKVKKKLKKVNEKGWIKSLRTHDTGIGKTLEHYMDLKENNIALPDFGKLELKSRRKKTSSPLTLFTKSPEGISNREIKERFGYPDKEFPDIKIVHQTIMNGRESSRGFSLKADKVAGKIFLKHKNQKIGHYSLVFLKQKALEKIGDGLILVFAKAKKKNGHEYFHYIEGYILKGLDPAKFILYSRYDIRLGVYHSGKNVGKPHDHGSAFRISENDIPKMFKIKKKIL